MIELSIVMPCYKEADNLKILLPKIEAAVMKYNFQYEILIIDTQSPMDNTTEICSNFTNVKYVSREGGNDYGDAIRTGIKSSSGKYILLMDSDCSHDPEDIPRLYDEIISGGHDVVIGSRYIRGGKTDNPFILRLMSRVLNICYRISFGLNVYDVSDSFRIYDGDKLREIKLTCDNFDIVEEILIRLRKKNHDIKIKEIPIFFNKRLYGESKRDLVRFIFSYLSTMYRLKKLQYREENES